MANCTVCSDVLLRHIRSGRTYWFCRRCRVEIMESGDFNSGNSINSLLSQPEEIISATHLSVATSEGVLPHPSPRS